MILSKFTQLVFSYHDLGLAWLFSGEKIQPTHFPFVIVCIGGQTEE